jgi:hypothetical protein
VRSFAHDKNVNKPTSKHKQKCEYANFQAQEDNIKGRSKARNGDFLAGTHKKVLSESRM